MHIIATFEQSTFLELALSELKEKGIADNRILAAPLEKKQQPAQLFDTIHRADGIGMFDLAAIFGTIGMLLGAVYGYVLSWGPILWGIIGAVTGMLLGFGTKWLIVKSNGQGINGKAGITSEVVLIIHCEKGQRDTVETTLWNNRALGISRIQNGENT